MFLDPHTVKCGLKEVEKNSVTLFIDSNRDFKINLKRVSSIVLICLPRMCQVQAISWFIIHDQEIVNLF